MFNLPLLRRVLTCAAFIVGLATVPLAAAAESAPAHPALFAVRGKNATVYLFGTIHFLRPDTPWRTDRIKAAMSASDTLALEVADPDDKAAVGPLIQQYGQSPQRPLSSILPPEDLADLDKAATSIGGSARQMDAMRPWLAGVMLSSAGLSRAGYDPRSGVDVLLRSEAKQAGKTIVGLETPEDQVRMLAGFPEEGQIAFLRSALRDFEAAPVELDRLGAAWAVGDTNAITAITLKPMRDRSERLYQALIVERNQRWARRIESMAQGEGVKFVAVGVLHLSGEDGLPAILRARGFTVDAVQE